MHSYDPDTPRAGAEWLELDETERLELVRAYHRRKRIALPNAELHAVIHVVVENQLALGEQAVAHTLSRLEREGLTRHDAVHAIGSILAEHLYRLMCEDQAGQDAAHAQYFARLEKLTAAAWRAG